MGLSIQHVTKKFGEFTAVDGLNLEIEKGKMFGMLGANEACICRQICEERKPSQRIT